MWEIILWILLFIGSYFVIFYAADLFIDNLKDICLIYNLSPFIIGMLVLGIDPEESIASIVAALNGLPYISMGNVIGNSIIAMTLPFALPLFIKRFTFKTPGKFYFIILYFLMFIVVLGFIFENMLSISGIIALAAYFIYFIRNVKYHNKEEETETEILDKEIEFNEEELEELKQASKIKKVIFIIIGLTFIIFGGELLVISAENLVTLLNIPEIFFGSVIIGFVTNVEEITLVIKSIQKKSVEIGIGGMIGKLIWNLTITFGVSGIIIMNMSFNWILILNWIILIGTILIFNISSRAGKLERRDGILLFTVFLFFILLNSLFL
jgi:cation:H+ antiporter